MADGCIDSCTPQEGFPTPGTPQPSYKGSQSSPPDQSDMSSAVKQATQDAMDRRNRNREMINSVGK
jgi:hypothetical protein